MKMSCVIFALLLLVPAFGDKFDHKDESNIKNCFDCRGLEEKDAYDKGCLFASALTHSDKSYPHNPSCSDSCNEAYSDPVKQKDCISGCIHFTELKHDNVPEVFNSDPIFGFMHNIAMNMMNKFHNAPINPLHDMMPKGEAMGSDDGEPHWFIKRIRIFIPKITNEDEPIQVIAPHVETGDDMMDMPHISVAAEGFRTKFRRWFHQMFASNTFIIILLSVVFGLLWIRVGLCCFQRCRKRQHYTPLPTYDEPTLVKVPIEFDVVTEKPEKKSTDANL